MTWDYLVKYEQELHKSEEWPVTFVTDGVEGAIERAKVIAGVKKVVVASAKGSPISPTASKSRLHSMIVIPSLLSGQALSEYL